VKKIMLTLIVSMVLLAVLVVSCAAPTPTPTLSPSPSPSPTPAPTPEQEVYEWNMQTSLGPALAERNAQPLADDIYKMSNGRIKITVYPDGALVGQEDLADALNEGAVEMGTTCSMYIADKKPVGDCTFLPFAWSNGDDAEIIMHNLGLNDLLREAYAELGVYFINERLSSEYYLLVNQPVKTIEDLAKLKIRATGTQAEWMADLGISATYYPASELYTSLASGIIDGCLYAGAVDYGDLGLFEVAKYILKPSVVYPTTDATVMSLDLWNSLSEDLQEIIIAAAQKNSRHEYRGFQVLEWSYLADAVENQGVTVTYFSDEDMVRIREAAGKCWDKVAAKSPRAAAAVEIVRDWLRTTGRL